MVKRQPRTAGRNRCVFRAVKVQRCGISLIEVIVSLTVVSLLVALLLPAVMSARDAARTVQCRNNLRALGLAMVNLAESTQRFPASGNFSRFGPERYHNWAVSVLPWIDQNNLHEQWNFDRPVDVHPNSELATTSVAVFACPSDPTVVAGAGNLSYVTNGGFGWTIPTDCPATFRPDPNLGTLEQPIDLNGDGVTCGLPSTGDGQLTDGELLLRSGMFFNENWPYQPGGTVRHHRLDTIRDGRSNTIMISENVRVGYDPYGTGHWASPEPWRNSFFISGYVCHDLSCTEPNVDYRNANTHGDVPAAQHAINAPLTQPEGEAPWLSSLHHGGVNAVYADGSVRFVSELIDGAVLASLLSPRGMDIHGPLRQLGAVTP